MSPLLLNNNTNQYNINGLLCTYTEMFRIQTCCNHILSAAEEFRGAGGNMRGSRNFCQFYLVLSLFYSLKRGFNDSIAEKTILILYKGSRGRPLFSGGGGGGVSNFFPGGGVQMLISIETHICICYFPGGVSGPPIPLWIHTWAMSSRNTALGSGSSCNSAFFSKTSTTSTQ